MPFHRTSEYVRSITTRTQPNTATAGTRHYFATLLIHNGAAVKTVQLALGHSTPMITLNTYAHERSDALDRTRTLVDTALGSHSSKATAGVGQ
jgi:integrase